MNSIFKDIRLEKESDVPLYRQLAEAVKLFIEDGRLSPETKLPPIRTLAKVLSVNNMTAVSAYKYLESRKYIYSAVGSGTYVSPLQNTALPVPILKNEYSARELYTGTMKDAVNFADTSTDPSLFPVDAFKQAFNAVLDRDKGEAFNYQDAQGYAPLRESVCEYLDDYAIRLSPDCVQIISGAQQGLDILAKALLSPGDTLLTEAPTFYGAVAAVTSRGAQVVAFPLYKDGPDIAKVEALLKLYKPKCIYVMPNFQTPTGFSYSLEKKRCLLELAYQYDTWIIEEDNQNDFYYDDYRRVPLKALDYRSRVIYVKSFSKILMPGLRLGFMALPKKLVVTSVKRNTDIATSGFIQRALDMYLRSGGLREHAAHMRKVYTRRYQAALSTTEKYLSAYVTFDPPGGGLSFWLLPRSPKILIDELCGTFLQRNVIVTPGSVFSSKGDARGFRISFASVSEAQIEEGIKIIASVMGMNDGSVIL